MPTHQGGREEAIRHEDHEGREEHRSSTNGLLRELRGFVAEWLGFLRELLWIFVNFHGMDLRELLWI
jgi:hypothetical protein